MGLTTARRVTTTEVWGDGRKESYVYRLGDGSSLQQTDRQLVVLSFILKKKKVDRKNSRHPGLLS